MHANLNINFAPDFANFVAKSTQSGEFFVSKLFVDNLLHIFNPLNIAKFRDLTLNFNKTLEKLINPI